MQGEISWQAFEYEFKPKSANWFWVVWILALGISWTAYLFQNVLFGILILVSSFCLSIFASRKPNLISIKIDSEKIIIGNKIVNYSEIESFWIEETKILLKSKKKMSPFIIVPLNSEIDRSKIKEYLLDHLEEIEQHESFFQTLLEKIW